VSREIRSDGMGVWAWLVVATGALLILGVIAYGMLFEVVTDRPATTREYLVFLLEVVTLVLLAGFVFGVVAGGVWLGRSSFGQESQRRVAGWCLVGLFGSILVIVVLQGNELLVGARSSTRFLVQDAVVAVSGGTFAGMLLGVYDANLRRHSAEVVAQRNALATANELLRHHVLNGMQVVLGYTDIVREEAREADERHLDAVADRGRGIVDLVQRMGYLMRSLAERTELYPVAVGSVVTDRVDDLRTEHPEVSATVRCPEPVRVRADDLLGEVVWNLLDNAVVHSDCETPTIEVTVTRDGNRAMIEVADDGPGIRDERKESVFEPEESTADVGRGLGLYLVETIVDRYEGAVHVEDNDPRGAVFVVVLPAASA
jgi:signal transduction histidine kinase